MKNVLYCLLTLLLLLFCISCAKQDKSEITKQDNQSSVTISIEPALSASDNSVSPKDDEQPDKNILTLDGARRCETAEEAFQIMVDIIAEAPYPYETIIRNTFLWNGNEIPCHWIFGRNALGETIDILIVDEQYDLELTEMTMNVYSGLGVYRKNELQGEEDRWHVPGFYRNLGWIGAAISDNHRYVIYHSGQSISKFDVRDLWEAGLKGQIKPGDLESGDSYWDGTKLNSDWKRPEIDPPEEDLENWPQYWPADNLEAELAAMQGRINASEKGYSVEIQDEITIDGKAYPVKWLSILNDQGEWADVIFSNDPELCYVLRDHHEELPSLRTCLPGERTENDNEWILEDMFNCGYSYYAFGELDAIHDCGPRWRLWSTWME